MPASQSVTHSFKQTLAFTLLAFLLYILLHFLFLYFLIFILHSHLILSIEDNRTVVESSQIFNKSLTRDILLFIMNPGYGPSIFLRMKIIENIQCLNVMISPPLSDAVPSAKKYIP